MSYFINKKTGEVITASSKQKAVCVFSATSNDFFELVKILDENNIKYDKTTCSFNIEKGVVINNSYILKLVGDTFIYGNISDDTTNETDDFDVVKKWFDNIVSKINRNRVALEKEKKKQEIRKIPLKDFVGEGKQIEQIRRKIEKEYPRYVINENHYPARLKSRDKERNSFLLDYKNKVYSITKVDCNGFVLGRPYRTTNFEKFLESVYNYVYLDDLEFRSNS